MKTYNKVARNTNSSYLNVQSKNNCRDYFSCTGLVREGRASDVDRSDLRVETVKNWFFSSSEDIRGYDFMEAQGYMSIQNLTRAHYERALKNPEKYKIIKNGSVRFVPKNIVEELGE